MADACNLGRGKRVFIKREEVGYRDSAAVRRVWPGSVNSTHEHAKDFRCRTDAFIYLCVTAVTSFTPFSKRALRRPRHNPRPMPSPGSTTSSPLRDWMGLLAPNRLSSPGQSHRSARPSRSWAPRQWQPRELSISSMGPG